MLLLAKRKEKNNMLWPVNIASEKAKLIAKKETLVKKIAKIDEKLAELEK